MNAVLHHPVLTLLLLPVVGAVAGVTAELAGRWATEKRGNDT